MHRSPSTMKNIVTYAAILAILLPAASCALSCGQRGETRQTSIQLINRDYEQLEALGMQIGLTLPEYGVIEGSLPYDQVEAAAGLDFVVSAGTPGCPRHNNKSGGD